MTILPDLPDLLIEHVSVTNEVTVIVRDLPASGRPLHLIVHVRRFFCQQSTYIRKIKASRFPSLTLPRAKFTLRLQEDLRDLGFALGGEAGARLGRRLSIHSSPDTLLRLVKQADGPLPHPHERDLLHERDARRTNDESAYGCPASADLGRQ